MLLDSPKVGSATKDEWIRQARLSVERVCGYAHIPTSEVERLALTPEEVIGENQWEFRRGTCSLTFRKRQGGAAVEFGGEKPKKPKKTEAAYVWKSMI